MHNMYEKLERALAYVKKKTDFIPEVAVTLGSGLGNFADTVEIEAVIPYGEIEGFPVSTVEGHKGRFLFGHCSGVPVGLMQGRVHYYEGYNMPDVVMPVRLMGLMGAKVLFLTNAAGGIDPSFQVGDLMLITGQIASFVPSPLRGPNIRELGERFPDMSGLYPDKLCAAVRMAAQETHIRLQEGVYIQLPGPNFESSAEIKMCAALGASAVGMSTACEAIAARHMGMDVCGVSLITNLAAGISSLPQTSDEVNENALRSSEKFCTLMRQSLINIHKKL